MSDLKSGLLILRMVFMTYAFLELFRVSNNKALKLEAIGNTMGYFRKQHYGSIVNYRSIVKFVFTCAKNNLNINVVLSGVGIAV